MQHSFWKRVKRRMGRALAHARRQALPERLAKARIYGRPSRLLHQLHVLECKFVRTEKNMMLDFEFCDLAQTMEPTTSRNLHADHSGHPVATVADARQALHAKTKFCTFVFSNWKCATRNQFLEILSQHMRVEVGGRVMRCSRHGASRPPEARYVKDSTLEIYRPYKFVIAFENSLGLHYTSEKLATAINAHTVPVYWGNPNITNYVNPERFINAFDFDTLESLARHVMRVHADDELYLRYLSQPSCTPRQEGQRFKERVPQHRFGAMQRQLQDAPGAFSLMYQGEGQHSGRRFFEQYARLMTGRALPLAQRSMFHRECLSRFAREDRIRVLAECLIVTSWPPEQRIATRHFVSHQHAWPHPVFYQVVDMAERLDAKD